VLSSRLWSWLSSERGVYIHCPALGDYTAAFRKPSFFWPAVVVSVHGKGTIMKHVWIRGRESICRNSRLLILQSATGVAPLRNRISEFHVSFSDWNRFPLTSHRQPLQPLASMACLNLWCPGAGLGCRVLHTEGRLPLLRHSDLGLIVGFNGECQFGLMSRLWLL
jgi:hypothetical protein